MPPVNRVSSVVPPGPAAVLAVLDAGAARRSSALTKLHYLLAYRRDTLVIETWPSCPAVTPHHA